MIALVLALGVSVLFISSRAASKGDDEALRTMAFCAKIESLQERMPCYNDLSIGTWHMMVSTRGGVYMSTLSVASHQDRFVRPKLLLACDDKTVLVFINWRDALESALKGAAANPIITVKFDGGSFESSAWEFAAGNRITYLRGQTAGSNAARLRFINRLIRAQSLTVRVRPN